MKPSAFSFQLSALLLALVLSASAQQTTAVQKGGAAGTNNITADLNIGTGRTLTIASGGTFTAASGSTVNLSAAGITYGAALEAIDGLTPAADKLAYFTSGSAAALADFTAFGRTLLDDADALTARATLGLTIGTNVQAYDADLTTYAGITPAANTQSLLGAANYSAMRTLLTLVPGTDVQAYDADLLSIAGNVTGGFLTRTASNTYTARTITGTAGEIDVAFGDGVSGAPTISLPGTITQATTFSNASGLAVSGNLTFGTSGSVLNGTTGSIGLTATGTNQSITLAPSGTGVVQFQNLRSVAGQNLVLGTGSFGAALTFTSATGATAFSSPSAFQSGATFNAGLAAADTASSGGLSVRVGIIASSPTNSTDSWVATNNTGGPGQQSGDLLLIPRSSSAVPSAIRLFSHSAGVITNSATLNNAGNLLLGTTTDANIGKLQLAAHTSPAGGIAFSADLAAWRSSSRVLQIGGLSSGVTSGLFEIDNASSSSVARVNSVLSPAYASAASAVNGYGFKAGTSSTAFEGLGAYFSAGANSASPTLGYLYLGPFGTEYIRANSSGLVIPATTASTSTSTGALQVSGGVGIAGRTSTATLNTGGTNGSTIDLIASNTATLDFGSISAAASADLTITVTGASTGDSVSLGLPAAPTAGIVFNAFVSAANTVTVRAFNITGSPVDPASATYRATVTSF